MSLVKWIPISTREETTNIMPLFVLILKFYDGVCVEISSMHRITNLNTGGQHQTRNRPIGNLMTIVRKRKMKWLKNVMKPNNLSLDIFQDTIFGKRKTNRKVKMSLCELENLLPRLTYWHANDRHIKLQHAENNHRIQAIFLVTLMVVQFVFNSFFFSTFTL